MLFMLVNAGLCVFSGIMLNIFDATNGNKLNKSGGSKKKSGSAYKPLIDPASLNDDEYA